MSDAARLATVIIRLAALCMMAVGPISLVTQIMLVPAVLASFGMIMTMLGGAALYMVPGFILYRLAPRVGQFVARGLQ